MFRVKKDAFAIIELIIVLIIISIIVSFTLFRFLGAIQESLLEKAALVLKSDIQLCQKYADTQNKRMEINFYPTYYTHNCENGNFVRKLTHIKIVKTTFRSRAGLNKLTFSPNGTPIPGGTVTLETSRGKQVYLVVPVGGDIEPYIRK